MKKTYIQPNIEVVKITAMQLLAGSDPQLSGEFNPGSDPILSRDSDFSFDEY